MNPPLTPIKEAVILESIQLDHKSYSDNLLMQYLNKIKSQGQFSKYSPISIYTLLMLPNIL